MAARIGISADGIEVFDNGFDAIGRSVTRAATPSVPGSLIDGTAWFLDAGGAAPSPVPITFPLSLPATPGVRYCEWTPLSVVARVMSPFTLQQQIQAHQGQAWKCRFELPAMTETTAEAWVATLLALNGIQGTFLFGDTVRKTPRGSAGGTPLVHGMDQIGQVLMTDGWPGTSNGVLLAGDWIQLGSGVTTRAYRVLTDTNSDSVGRAAINIWPRLRESPADNAPLILSNTKMAMRLADSAHGWGVNEAKQYGLEIDAVEAI